MIYKERRDKNSEFYDLKIIDSNGNLLTMMVGGNQDLYWIPQKGVTTYKINKDDEMVYNIFLNLFETIKEKDIYKCLSEDKTELTYISEDAPTENADILKIKEMEGVFVLRFIQNPNPDKFIWKRLPSICFCNSGSPVPEIEHQFMLMFNNNAYYNVEIKEQETKPKIGR